MNKLRALAALTACCWLLQISPARAACPDTTEDYNPYFIQGIVSPAPLLPVEFNGTGTLAFDVGNTGSTELCLVAGQQMTMVITLSKGIPNNADPIAALGGNAKDWFSWTYDQDTTTYTATQIATIPAASRETLTIDYLLTENSYLNASPTVSNGYNANLQPPDYSTGSNATDDDNVSSYTYVGASDFADAPASYGAPQHNIDLTRNETSGNYNNYIYLGTVVDPESVNQPSDGAVGDDDNQTGGLGTDDEDGFIFPESIPVGEATAVPMTVTRNGYTGAVRVQHWVDWDRDGVFDAGEQGTQVTGLPGVLPEDEVSIQPPPGTPNGPYYARFRISTTGGLDPTSAATDGEVEDHIIQIGTPTAVTMGDVELIVSKVSEFLRDIGVKDMSRADLLALLSTWDRFAAERLQNASRGRLLKALRDYLDPDRDGKVIVFAWETLEERGTIGFYAERSQGETWTPINTEMLPGLIAAPMGAQYWLADPDALPGNDYQYRLKELDAWGRIITYGPFDLQATTH
jgi:hypothetical protein